MLKTQWSLVTVCGLSCSLLVLTGCNEETEHTTKKVIQEAGEEAGELGEKAKESAGELGEKTKEAAGDLKEKTAELSEETSEALAKLGEQAKGYLSPIKAQLGSLSDLKDNPAELKASVDKILEMISAKAESITLPESLQQVVQNVKTKLTDLKDHLGSDEAEPAQIEKHLDEVQKAASGLN
jgi:chromosome segregation ATPase